VSTFYAEAFKGAITPLLAAGFVLIPLPFFAAGLFSSHFIFFPRYAVTCVTGVAGLVAIAWHLASRGGRRAGIAALVMLTGWVALARGKEALALARDPGSQFRDDHAVLVSALSDGKPVAIWNINTFLEADFYLRGNELSHLNYVVPEREIGRRYLWQDFNSHVAPLLGTIAPLRARVIPWREFEQTDAFLLHEEGTPSWWYEALPEQGWKRTLKLHLGEEYVWEVSRAARQARRFLVKRFLASGGKPRYVAPLSSNPPSGTRASVVFFRPRQTERKLVRILKTEQPVPIVDAIR
jgi:hypothetical protein